MGVGDAFQRKVSGAVTRWRLRWVTERLRRAAPERTQGRPVVFFNASTRLWGMSLNAGFQWVTAWSLRLQGVPVVQFVCQAGMPRCVLGTDPDRLHQPPPCALCQAWSRRLYRGLPVQGFTYTPDADLDEALEAQSVTALETFAYRGVPLGALTLPSVRWRLRRHNLHDDEATRALYRDFIRGAWQVARAFGALLDEVQPQAVVVFNGQFFPEATARWVAQQRGVRDRPAGRPASGRSPARTVVHPLDQGGGGRSRREHRLR